MISVWLVPAHCNSAINGHVHVIALVSLLIVRVAASIMIYKMSESLEICEICTTHDAQTQ